VNAIALQLPGYEVDAVLYRYDGRVVYRARRLDDNTNVAIETFDTEYPQRLQVAAIRREGAVAQRLNDVDGVRKVFDILSHGSGNVALVCELYEGSLQSYLERFQGGGLPVVEVLDIAIRLAKTLGEIHAHDIVHKALTPQHVLMDPHTGHIALSGFGVASELDQERQSAQVSNQLVGPYPYMSPEQTGRMNRDLDYRSDYYSLGVLLFELLTGERPFAADNLLEWVYSHISRAAPEPREVRADIPGMVSAIVVKLLTKNPEERYQSSEGLIHDLSKCLEPMGQGQEVGTFSLGERDVVHKFLMPQNLYGREKELGELLWLVESAVAGHVEICIVHGYSGVGKSALVNEIDRPLIRERGFLVQGKFEQFQQGDAYSAVSMAFRGLVHQLLAQTEDRLSEWRDRLQTALAPNARLVVDLVPELELIIGPQPDVVELPPAEARNRQQIVLNTFLRIFAGAGHPVVMFLDDLQWSDAPTLALLRRLVSSRELSHLLLIGAYRSNEVGVGHPLRLLLEDLQAHKNIHQIPLAPLERDSMAQLVADALKRKPDETAPLSDLIYDKAQGNPFFTNELLRQMYKEGVIARDKDSGRWDWDLDAARWSDVSSDVVEFMVDNLRSLPPDTQQVLQLAACIGGSFDLHTLAAIYQHPVDEVARALLPALKQRTILPLNDDYRLVVDCEEAPDINPVYRFQHDRVQQAAYALIVAQRLGEVHLNVGRLMMRHAGDTVPDERLIDVVGHLNEGRPLIDSAEERLQLAKLNLRAGVRARRSAAYEAALKFLRNAKELLPTEPWLQMPEMMWDLANETQLCTYLSGRSEEAERWTDQLLEHAGSDLVRSDILATRTRQFATLGRMEESILSAIQGLALLGVDFTDQPTKQDIAEERRLITENLGGREIAGLVDAVAVEDPEIKIAMRLLMEIFPAAFLSGSGNLFPYLVLKAVNLSLRYGNSPESAFIYAAYGMVLCGEFNDPALGHEYARLGLQINERLDDIGLRARVIYVYAMFVHHWNDHWASLTPWFRKGIEAGYQSGDLLYLAYSALDCVIWDPTLDLETAHRLHAENLEIVRECDYQDSLDSGTLFLQFQRNLLGLTNSPLTLSDDDFDEQKCLAGMRERQFMTGIANYHIYSAEIGLLYGNYEYALQHIVEQDELIKSAMSLPQLVRFYIVAFLVLATRYPKMSEEQRTSTAQRLQRALKRMTAWADNCEANFRHLQYLMEAELASLDDQRFEALERYDDAIDAARQSGFLHDEATAFERAARFLTRLGCRRSAEGYLRGAHRLYDRWGALAKVRQMEQEFPVLRELAPAAGTSGGHHESGDLDLASVMKASREISGEIVLDKLLKTTMGILLENAGGQWGCLVVRRDDKLVAEVVKRPAETSPAEKIPAHSLVEDGKGGRIPLPVTLISRVLHSDEAVVLHDAAHQGQFIQDPYVLRFTPSSVLCIPLRRERFEAALYMENNLASGAFTEDRVEIIRLLAAQASVAIENASLYEQVQDYSRTLEDKVAERTARLEQLNKELQSLVHRDGLTGVANRRRGDEYLEETWARLRRNKLPLSVIMLDVDHFKAYNDNYGHQAGDDCLMTVAKTVNDELKRPTDLVVRYGGEEFMLILPDTDNDGAAQVGEQVRRAVEQLAIEHNYSTAARVVTVSAGTATMVPQGNESTEQVVREADIALYRAKRMGRNQVHAATYV
jgi:diguanylate cyclase (GGDEF)-like protein